MKTTIRRWGNSAAVRIPTTVMQAVDLDVDDPVDVREEAGRLVRRITKKNRHEAVDFGSPAGKEDCDVSTLGA